jgi:hypothetical protein
MVADLKSTVSKYDPTTMKQGYNCVAGEDVFFVPNPGLGLLAHRDRFKA